MKRKIIVLLLVVIALGLAGILRSGWFRRDNPNRLRLSGNIELTEVDISFKAPGKLVELNVDEGSFVRKGMVIARIDREQMERQRMRDSAGVASAESQFKQMQTMIAYQRETLESDVALKKAEQRAAQAKLDELLAGSRPQDIQVSRAAVADAGAQHEQARLDWDRARELFKNDDISRAQYDQFRMRFESSAAQLKQADERLAIVVEGP